jgi:hypothetical protein
MRLILESRLMLQSKPFSDLYNHEVIHREFFKAALTGALPDPSSSFFQI